MAMALCAAAPPSLAAGDEAATDHAQERASFTNGLIEFKRQNTGRGTPGESTKTNLKFDYFPQQGPVALLRLELPFPDANTSFAGSAFDPDFGDAKTRIGFRAIDVAGHPTTSFVELTFPTARPQAQGSGKYQLSLGAKMAFALDRGASWVGRPTQAFSVQVQQVTSVAGDAVRKDINQTKFELEWRDTWPGGHYGKATAKPVVDWVGNGQTGAVLELEGGWAIDRRWMLALMLGGLLWGDGVPSTYSKRAELKLIYRY